MTVKHNYIFINLLFLLITGCLYDYIFRSTCDHPQVYKSYYLHVLIVHDNTRREKVKRKVKQ